MFGYVQCASELRCEVTPDCNDDFLVCDSNLF
jgi:hypothetical protein